MECCSRLSMFMFWSISSRAGETSPVPTVLQIGPFRFFFYSADGREPPHVHVERDAAVAKFWLAPVRLARSGGFRPHELGSIEELVS
jgi:hypothetical protein